MVNDIVKSIVQHNDYARIRLMTCGTKVFGKQEGTEAKREGTETHFRVLSEGLPVVLPYIGPKAIVHADFASLKIFMESYYPLTSGFPESFQSMINAKGACGAYRPVPEQRLTTAERSSQRQLRCALPARSIRGCYVSVFPFPNPMSTLCGPAHTRYSDGRLAHELVLPIWKSNVSVMLMLDKRAKRYVHALRTTRARCLPWAPSSMS